jgi:adenylylsulfate kinase
MFDWTKPTAILIGRYQPPHEGHLALVKEALTRTEQVCILIRIMPPSDANPLNHFKVISLWERMLVDNGLWPHCIVLAVPNVSHVFYGRDVGYKIEYLELSPELQAISATKIREQMKKGD